MNIYRKRLKLLAWYLKSVPEKHFNIECWVRESGDSIVTACAGGWATQIPEFIENGLWLSGDKESAFWPRYTAFPRYKNYIGFTALEKFFNLTSEEALYLFSSITYRDCYFTTGKIVVKRINDFIAERLANEKFV